jgi:hypothetical protein
MCSIRLNQRTWLQLGACLMVAATVNAACAESPKGELAGRIVDLDGNPVASARVWLETEDYPAKVLIETSTQSDGRFRLGPLSPVYRRRLLVEAEGFGREPRDGVSVFAGIVNDLGELTVARGRAVSGRVLDPDGRPLAGVAVEAEIFRHYMGHTIMNVGPARTIQTDATGRYRLMSVPPSNLTITVRYPECTHGGAYKMIQPGSGEEFLEDVKLVRDAPIIGVVKDTEGKLLAGIEVKTGWAGNRTAKTDTQGRFVLRGFKADDQLYFRMWADGFTYYEKPVPKDRSAVQIVLTRCGWINGRAVDADTGEPVQLKEITLCQFDRQKDGTIVRRG